jgi:hypothetical protein
MKLKEPIPTFKSFLFNLSQPIHNKQGYLLGTIISRLWVQGMGEGISRCYLIRHASTGEAIYRFENELRK